MKERITISFISISEIAFPSNSMLHTTFFNCKDTPIAQDGLLSFSFSINRFCATFRKTTLKEAAAAFLDFCAFTSSFLSFCACKRKVSGFLIYTDQNYK